MTDVPRNRIVVTDQRHLDDDVVEQTRGFLAEQGWVVLRGLPLGDDAPRGLAALVRRVAGSPLGYHERSSPRSELGDGVYTSTEYPASEEIHLHNENSYQLDWPMRLFFQCLRPAATGGATPLADTRQILATMDPAVRDRFADLGWRVVRNYHEGMGLTWQESFGVTDHDQLTRLCEERGLVASWHDGVLRTSATRAAIHRHPTTGQDVWFNHAAVFHLASRPPAVRSALREMFAEDELPTQSYFGNGDPIDDDTVEHLVECYAAARFRFDYQAGDVLVIDNMLISHGREPFTGDRAVAVAMACPRSEFPAALSEVGR
ncbi:TauD/TfdA family dioxygenase [Actinokineospora guangxiensis]|uniref:TauD/TfdA family dioxygenase n=1 Tax=Actinokineospora guangxiensis TaxID=1490288 RepID=A0ABW0EV83_9PSEU